MARRQSVWAWILGSMLALATPCPALADDASAFAASTVADLIAHGTEAERLWGRHALGQLSATERTRALELIQWHESRPDDAEGRRRKSGLGLPSLRVSLDLKYVLAPRTLLQELGVDLRGLQRDSPPYPTDAERRAGSPMLETRPDVEVLERLHAAIEDGRLRVVGSAQSENEVGALQTLSVLEPADAPRPGKEGALPGGAVLHVQPYFTGPPRLGSLSIRRIVAARSSQDEEAELQIVGSSHLLDPSWGLHVAVRDGEVLLLSPRWAVGRAWTGDVLPLLVLTCRALPQPADCVIDFRPGQGAPMQKHVAPVDEVLGEGTRVVFHASPTDCFFFGERLTVARGAAQKQYVTVIEIVGIRGTRIEARSIPMLQKHAIEMGDHIVWRTSSRN